MNFKELEQYVKNFWKVPKLGYIGLSNKPRDVSPENRSRMIYSKNIADWAMFPNKQKKRAFLIGTDDRSYSLQGYISEYSAS